MFIVDLYTLQTVYTLYFTQHVILNSVYALDSQNVMRIYTTFCQLIAGLKNLSIKDFDTRTVWDQVSLGIACLRIVYDDLTFLLSVVDRGNTWDLCDDRKTLQIGRASCRERV